jgi:hypothetical protein
VSDDLEPLDPDLAALLVAERRRAGASAESKARVHARLSASLFGPGGGGGSAGGGAAPKTQVLRALAAFAIGAASGGAAVYAWMPPRIVTQHVEIPVAAPPEDTSVSSPRIERDLEPAASANAGPSSAVAPLPADSLVAERALLDPARTALGRGDGASALDAVKKHEQRYPSGKLVEEREAIATQALVLAGRKEEARTRGQRFLARYPGSMLAPMVEAAIDAAK